MAKRLALIKIRRKTITLFILKNNEKKPLEFCKKYNIIFKS